MSEPAPAGNVFQEYFINVFRYKYVQYQGRARRREYWMFCLFYTVLELIFVALFAMGLDTLGNYLSNIFSAATLLPSVCLGIRRLHDIGKSGWWILVFYGIIIVAAFILGFSVAAESLVGLVVCAVALIANIVVFLVFLCLDSQPGENQYGPNPKTASGEITETLI